MCASRFKAWGNRPMPIQGGRRRRCTNSGWPVGPTLIIEAEAIRQSSLFSARMSTSNSGEIKELLAMMRIQTAVSLSSFCTIRIL